MWEESHQKAWKQQKKLKEKPIPSFETIKDTIMGIKHKRNRALITMLYITAGRVGEIVSKGNTIGVHKKNIEIVQKDGRSIMLLTVPNEKNNERKWKDLPIPLDEEIEYVRTIRNYIKKLSFNDALFRITTGYAWQISRKELGYNCHWLRHIRLSHLVLYYDFNAFLLQMFAGWSDIRPAKKYMELRWSDMLDKM